MSPSRWGIFLLLVIAWEKGTLFQQERKLKSLHRPARLKPEKCGISRTSPPRPAGCECGSASQRGWHLWVQLQGSKPSWLPPLALRQRGGGSICHGFCSGTLGAPKNQSYYTLIFSNENKNLNNHVQVRGFGQFSLQFHLCTMNNPGKVFIKATWYKIRSPWHEVSMNGCGEI